MPTANLAADGGLSDVINLINLVKSPGNSSTTTSNNINTDTQHALLDSILSGSTAIPGLAAVSQGQKTAGLYGSTINQQLTNDLLARSTAAIAEKNSSSTVSKHQAPTFSGKDLAVMFAASGLKKVLGPSFKGLADKTGISDVGDKLADSLGLGANSSLDSGATNLFAGDAAAYDSAATTGIASSLDVGAGAGIADIAGLTSLDSAAAAGTGADIAGSTALTEGGADVAGLTALDSAASAGTDIALTAGVTGAGEAAAGGGLLDGLAAVASEAAPAAVAWVICTHLNSVGLLEDTLYEASWKRAAELSPQTIKGYHFWAIPLTRQLRKSEYLTKIFGYLAKSRCEYLLGNKRIWGWLSVIIGEPICTFIGRNIPAEKVEDWKELYHVGN